MDLVLNLEEEPMQEGMPWIIQYGGSGLLGDHKKFKMHLLYIVVGRSNLMLLGYGSSAR